MTSDILRDNTPIEQYVVNGRVINVKREDLSTFWPAPSLAKLRGCLMRLEKVKAEGYTLVGCLDTRISKSGWGVAYLASKLGGIDVHAYYPELKAERGYKHQQQHMAEFLGAELHPMVGGRTAILYAKARREIVAKGGYMMPMGLVVEESVEAIAKEARSIPEAFLGGDIVVCTGSGMTLTGITKALAEKTNTIYGISAGMNISKQRRRAKSVGIDLPENVELILPEGVDYFAQDSTPTPFPSSLYYDRKAWHWMLDNLDSLRDPIVFWNIGV